MVLKVLLQDKWWRFKDTIKVYLYFKCPCCSGSQYRTSQFDISVNNPHGAKCIFCKSSMKTKVC
ncbi:hypothetical protein [Providencia alcalifaciens]|uniref:cold shock small protein YmcF n=1 Tax=Providencia alcalifaciens TaxID=126385 RepID=UPI0009072207|nr:hypothetical protein [Providencia alcalifaciens]